MQKVKPLSKAMATLTIEYVICRYLLFNLHYTKDLPLVLLILCVAVTCVATVLKMNKLIMCAVVGYIVSFFLGVTFNVEWIDRHGTACSSFGIWFACGVAFFTIIGVFWEVFSQLRINRN